MNLKTILCLLLCCSFLLSCKNEVTDPLKSLEEEKIHFLSLHLYPSTIRMVNIANDSSFFKATKNVKKAHYLQVNLDTPEKTAVYEKWQKEQDFSEWEELISARMSGSLVSIYTPKENEDLYFASITSNGMANLIFLEGQVDLNQVTQIMQNGINLGPVTDFLNDKKETEKQREKMKSMRKQMDELEEDSLQNETDSSENTEPAI